jgi:hypothetical protein
MKNLFNISIYGMNQLKVQLFIYEIILLIKSVNRIYDNKNKIIYSVQM